MLAVLWLGARYASEQTHLRRSQVPRYLLIAINGPTSGAGDDAEYNKWYDEVHAADLMSINGAVSVRRFKIEAQNRIDKPYVNVTEFEADSAAAVIKELALKASQFTDKIDRTTSVFVLGREITKDE
jgi:hypothetical protein